MRRRQHLKYVDSKKAHDKHVIASALHRYGSLCRGEIHDLTHLHPSEISRLVRELMEEGKLVTAGPGHNSKGRKQVLLSLNEEHAFVAGIGFDDESVLAGIMDLGYNIRAMVQDPTRLGAGPDGLVEQLLACTRRAIRDAGIEAGSLRGIAIAGSGLIDSRAGAVVMSSTINFLKNVALRHAFEEAFGVPTMVDNLSRAKAVAERTLGAAEMAANMIYVEYGKTGIGAGVILDGMPIHGANSFAGEFGHTLILEGGPACRCGSFGCLEAAADAAALETRIREALAQGSTSLVVDMAGGDVEKITGWMILEAANRGDKACATLVEQVATYLGLGLANLVNLFNPSLIVLDQRLSLAGEGFLDQVTKVVKRQALAHSTEHLRICFGSLGDEAVVLGAGSMAMERYFEIPALKPPRFMVENVEIPGRQNWPRRRANHLGIVHHERPIAASSSGAATSD
jgi:N-acetylglucosamine repressor